MSAYESFDSVPSVPTRKTVTGTWVIPAAVHTQFAECGCSKGLATAALNDKTNHASKQRTRCLACRSDCKFVMGSIIAENKGRLYTNTRLSKKRAPGGTPAQRTKQPGGFLAAVDKP